MASNPKLKKLVMAATNDWRVTNRLYPHLQNNPETASMVNTTAMGKVLMSLAKPPEPGVRAGAFHPSQLYQCERAQVFGFIGVPGKEHHHSPELLNLFNDGKWRHIRWQITLLNARIITQVEVPVRVPKYRFFGSMDGLNEPERWMLELKGTSQFADIKTHNVALPAHVKQVHGYLFGAPDIEEAVILYEDKSSNQWHEIIVRRRKNVIREIEGILNALNEAVEHKHLPPILPECQRGEGAYRQCQYGYLCKQVTYGEAEAAKGCGTSEEVIVKLSLKRRNTHQQGEPDDRKRGANGQGGSGDAEPVRTASGTLRVRRGASR